MKHAVYILAVVVVVVGVVFWFMRSPVVAPEPSTSPTPSPNIIVDTPSVGATVSSPITVTGTARTFEQGINWRLTDQTGTKLIEGNTTAAGADDSGYGAYSFSIPVPADAPSNLEIWVFQYSAKDGSVVDLVTVPVKVQ